MNQVILSDKVLNTIWIWLQINNGDVVRATVTTDEIAQQTIALEYNGYEMLCALIEEIRTNISKGREYEKYRDLVLNKLRTDADNFNDILVTFEEYLDRTDDLHRPKNWTIDSLRRKYDNDCTSADAIFSAVEDYFRNDLRVLKLSDDGLPNYYLDLATNNITADHLYIGSRALKRFLELNGNEVQIKSIVEIAIQVIRKKGGDRFSYNTVQNGSENIAEKKMEQCAALLESLAKIIRTEIRTNKSGKFFK